MKKTSSAVSLIPILLFFRKKRHVISGAALLFFLLLHMQGFSFPLNSSSCQIALRNTGFTFNGNNKPAADTWVFDKTVQNVDLYHMITECEGKKVVFLKFNNRNLYKVKISWKEVFVTQMEKAREGFRGMKQLVLPPGETAQSDCTDVKNKECIIISSQVSPAYPAEILKFEFKDINITNL